VPATADTDPDRTGTAGTGSGRASSAPA